MCMFLESQKEDISPFMTQPGKSCRVTSDTFYSSRPSRGSTQVEKRGEGGSMSSWERVMFCKSCEVIKEIESPHFHSPGPATRQALHVSLCYLHARYRSIIDTSVSVIPYEVLPSPTLSPYVTACKPCFWCFQFFGQFFDRGIQRIQPCRV